MEYLWNMLTLPVEDPVLIFCLVLLIILLTPIIFDRLHIPHIVGLIVAGVLLGPHSLHVLEYDSSFKLLGQVGLLYIMFLAGIDMNMNDFRENRGKSAVFGLLTFAIPMLLGIVTSVALIYLIYTQAAGGGDITWIDGSPSNRASLLKFCSISAIVLASMYASNTLISYPIAARFGITRSRSVNISVGGTMITTVLSLLVLAVSLEMVRSQLDAAFWIRFGLSIALLGFVLIFLYPRIGRSFFKRFDDPVMQYVFLIAMVFLASFLANLAGVQAIIGAFLAGITLNPLVPRQSSLLSRIHFVGNAIFIPFFLISVGMIVDFHIFLEGYLTWLAAIVMSVVATLSKYIAAVAARHTLKLSKDDGKMLFGLTNAQAAATLAAVVIAHGIVVGNLPDGSPVRLLPDEVLNGSILMILVTCLISSIATEQAARRLAVSEEQVNRTQYNPEHRILVSISHPAQVKELMDLAFVMKGKRDNQPIYTLHVVDESDPNSEKMRRSDKMLEKAKSLGVSAECKVKKISRYDLNITSGITNVVMEKNISDVVIGLRQSQGRESDKFLDTMRGEGDSFLGSILESLLRKVNRMICIYRPVQPIGTINRVILYVPDQVQFESGFRKWCHRVVVLCNQTGARLVIYGSNDTIRAVQSQMRRSRMNIKTYLRPMEHWTDLPATAHALRTNDLLVFVQARRTSLSYQTAFEHLPEYINGPFQGHGFIILYPEQFKEGEINLPMEDKSKII